MAASQTSSRRHVSKDNQLGTFGAVTILELSSNPNCDTERVRICTEPLLSMLTNIGNTPVVIVSINGQQRTGKSFLATQFVKYLKNGKLRESWLDSALEGSFEWREDFERVTSGIQIWHEPFLVKNDGMEVAVIIMDTQGLHDNKTSGKENSIIFGLSVLLSSVFIFNEINVTESTLQYLRSNLEFAKFAEGSNCLEFQKLVLLNRDYHAKTRYKFGYYDDKTCPRGQYENLKQAWFGQTAVMHPEAIDTRSGIQNCFEDISVYAMSGPGVDTPDVSKFASSSTWNPNFREGVIDFVETTFSMKALFGSRKKVFGQVVTGKQLTQYVLKWKTLIEGAGKKIDSKTIFEANAEIFFTQKIKNFLNEYTQNMMAFIEKNSSGVSDTQFKKQSNLFVLNIQTNFQKNAFGGETLLRKYYMQLKETLLAVETDLRKRNKDKKEIADGKTRERILKVFLALATIPGVLEFAAGTGTAGAGALAVAARTGKSAAEAALAAASSESGTAAIAAVAVATAKIINK